MSRPRLASLNNELVRAACTRWPHLPSRTLARMLVEKNKGVWPSLNAARCAVLYRRGRTLRTDRGRRYRCPEIVASTAPAVPWNPQAVPRSDERSFLPHIVSVDRDTRSLVLSDLHIPYHNRASIIAAIDHGRREDCRIVLINGDLLDFHRLSRFQKDPRSRSPKEEIARTNQFLDALDDAFPKARKIFKLGNHDERYEHYLAARAEELFEVLAEQASLAQLLELDSRGWEIVAEKRPVYLGKLTVIHGHEYPTPVIGPVNAARGLFLRAKECAMVAHHHQTSEHTDPTIRQKIITTWSTGCLCELHPMYARFNRWNHGAATVELTRGGQFHVHNFRIHQGRLLN